MQAESKIIKEYEEFDFYFRGRTGLTHQYSEKIGFFRCGAVLVKEALEDIKKKLPGRRKFLDLGSGLGLNVALACEAGFDSYGIEIEEKHEKGAEEFIEELKLKELLPEKNTAKIVRGSYYPNDYIEKRRRGESVAIVYENSGQFDIRHREFRFHPVGNEIDIYKQLDLRLEEVDIFFCYSWPLQIPSVLEMFKLYSGDNSTLLLASPISKENINELLETFELRVETDWPETFMQRWFSCSINTIKKKKVA